MPTTTDIPTELIDRALGLGGKSMESVSDPVYWDNGTPVRIKDEFSYPKFYAYLLSKDFIRSIPTGFEISLRGPVYKPYIFGEAIYEHQNGK